MNNFFTGCFRVSVLLTIALGLIISISGCAGPEGENNSHQNGEDNTNGSTAPSNVIEVIRVNEPTVWENKYIYVITTNRLVVSSRLTIEPGTIVKFNPGSSMDTQGDNAAIIAEGTIDAPIIFTSLFDDEHGGDTNGDGNGTMPARSDWWGISIGHASVFDYCHFLYGGYRQGSVLYLGSSIAVTNCIFAHNSGNTGGDYYKGALTAQMAEPGTIIAGNRFYDNIVPLSINENCELDDSNTFQSEDGEITNTYNAVFFNTNNHNIERNISFEETEAAIVMDELSIRISNGFSISLGDDVVLKFIEGGQMLLYDGLSALINHDGQGVYFTSFKDDSLKGDSNGDDDATTPADGDWEEIMDRSLSDVPQSERHVTWPNILYDSH